MAEYGNNNNNADSAPYMCATCSGDWGRRTTEFASLWITFASSRCSMVANILFMELLYDNESTMTAFVTAYLFGEFEFDSFDSTPMDWQFENFTLPSLYDLFVDHEDQTDVDSVTQQRI